MFADHDVGLVSVEDVEGVGHFLEEVDGSFGEVVEGVYFLEVVGVDRKMVGGVHHQYFFLVEDQGRDFQALVFGLDKLGWIE